MSLAEENRLQLIANEINLGFTFIESTRLSYSMGHTEHGQKAHEKAEAAYSGALRFLEGQSGSDYASLRTELNRLRAALDSLKTRFKQTDKLP